MSDFQKRLAELRAKAQQGKSSSTNETSISKTSGTSSTFKLPKPATTKPNLSKKFSSTETEGAKRPQVSLDSLTVQVSETKSKLEKHLQEQEEKGLYNLSEEVANLDGFNADKFIDNLRELDAATIEKTPDIGNFSRLIRKNLEQYPELVHILADEQLGIIVNGYLTMADVETAPKSKQGKAALANKKLAKAKEELNSLDINDLFAKKK